MPLPAILSDFVSLLFPQVCLACEDVLARGEEHMCTTCRAQLPYTDYHRLPLEQNPLARRFWGRVPVQHTLSYLRFQKHGRVQHLLHQLKYRGQQEVGRVLGRWYGQELREARLHPAPDLVVPVPLHARKLAQRGYNQADSFAEGLATGLQIPWAAEALRRTTYTNSQTQKNRIQRWQNVETVFAVAQPEFIQQKHVLLVDDVLTTGATLEACAAALLAAGAAQVSIATIATADR
ncbi:ComF family protein [Hymenobacter endophyticus]|uniref:Phosphoribosyltransferase family protein n=1 Tax=Hymenobacter endophyticus TaxID=3076335 RepID=A0ABU3TGT1_9BACT|nr:phosphoribosyltransferase family protein [Hymenobacter endophyticus]MDU0370592.1 phosphoribosyltransferase family protein [Hymenobacter endophyticus]